MNRLIVFALLIPFAIGVTMAQQNTENVKAALLIVDIQNFYFPGEGPGLVNAEQASLVARDILASFRDKKQLVIHVRHKSSKGFEIHKNVEPLPTEKVITKQEVNSFNGTDLLDCLKSNVITRLVIIGMQTHMCLEAATRAAYDFGFECIVVHDACATRDLKFGDKVIKAEDVHTSTLATIQVGGYGKVIDSKTFLVNPTQYLFEPFAKPVK
jgi:nicotinamidase-related amidase